MERILIDPSFVITHRLPLDEAPRGFAMLNDKENDCVKVVLKPNQYRDREVRCDSSNRLLTRAARNRAATREEGLF